MRKMMMAIAAIGMVAGAAQAAPDKPAATAPLTLDTPIEQIAADPRGRAILNKYMPRLLGSPAYPMVRSVSLRTLQPQSHGRVTPEKLAQVGAALKALR